MNVNWGGQKIRTYNVDTEGPEIHSLEDVYQAFKTRLLRELREEGPAPAYGKDPNVRLTPIDPEF